MIKEFRLTHEIVKKNLNNYVVQLPVDKEHPLIVSVHEEKRTVEQNNKMWVVLTCLAKQVKWDNEWLTKEEWKWMITAALKGQKAKRGIYGGIVFMGQSTSKMTKKQISEVIIEAEVFGSEHGVNWNDEARTSFKWVELYKEQLSKVKS